MSVCVIINQITKRWGYLKCSIQILMKNSGKKA